MIIYRKNNCYRHLFVTYQGSECTAKGKSAFQQSEIISIINNLTNKLSRLFQHVDKKDARRKITFLMRIDEELSAYENETVKNLISNITMPPQVKKKDAIIALHKEAYTFFYNVLKKDASYFKQIFNAVLQNKDTVFINDFIELTNTIVREHLSALNEAISADSTFENNIYFQLESELKEKKLANLQEKYKQYLKSIYLPRGIESGEVYGQFTFYQFFYVANLIASNVSRFFIYNKKYHKDAMITLCSDNKRSIAEKTLTDALTLLRAILFDDTNIFREKVSADFQLMNQAVKTEYFKFARQALTLLLQNIAKELDFSVEEKASLKPLADSKKPRLIQSAGKQEEEVKASKTRQNFLSQTTFFKGEPLKSTLKRNFPSQEKLDMQDDTKKRAKLSVSFEV